MLVITLAELYYLRNDYSRNYTINYWIFIYLTIFFILLDFLKTVSYMFVFVSHKACFTISYQEPNGIVETWLKLLIYFLDSV